MKKQTPSGNTAKTTKRSKPGSKATPTTTSSVSGAHWVCSLCGREAEYNDQGVKFCCEHWSIKKGIMNGKG